MFHLSATTGRFIMNGSDSGRACGSVAGGSAASRRPHAPAAGRPPRDAARQPANSGGGGPGSLDGNGGEFVVDVGQLQAAENGPANGGKEE